MFCPSCGDEYRAGFTQCADCGVPLVPERPAYPRKPGEQEAPDRIEFVEVYRSGRPHAELVCATLRGSGITAVVTGEGYASAYPVTVGELGAGRVLVPASDADDAREIVRAALQGELAIDDGMPEKQPGDDADV